MDDDNILYHDPSVGIIICLRPTAETSYLNERNEYPIILTRNTLGVRFSTIRTMPKHPWQHQIIIDTFEKIGWPVKVTANGRYYSLKNKKDRFRFKLKYGNSR